MDTLPAWPIYSVIKDPLLFLIAIYGAALSTINWRQAVRKERRAIVVRASEHSEHNDSGEPWAFAKFAKIEATNIGHRPVTVKTLTFELPTGIRMCATPSEEFPSVSGTVLPASLSDGQSAYSYMSYLYIACEIACELNKSKNRKIKLIPTCEDSAGGIHKGAPWAVDLDKLVP
jgi:hypothetical protein